MQIMTAVGFEPTQLALVELESTPLDHSGKLSLTLSCLSTLPAFFFKSGSELMQLRRDRRPSMLLGVLWPNG